jgi:hypothetical protein
MDADKLRRLAIDGRFSRLSHDNMGIYPMSIVSGEGGYEKRTERMEGWNDAVSAHTDNFMKLRKWHDAIPDDIRSMVDDLLLEKKLRVNVRADGCSMWVDCSDTFAWGCADGEDIVLDELPSLIECFVLSPAHGDELWSARKRGMRPQTACYRKRYPKDEWHLFDACGPERTDPDGAGRADLS